MISAVLSVRRLRKSSRYTMWFISIGVLVLVPILGPFVAPYSASQVFGVPFQPAGDGFFLGTDYLGRDILSRILWGARPTIGIAVLTVALSLLIGVGLGFFAALRRGWVDSLLSRFVDAVMSFPPLIIALIVIVGFGTTVPVLVAVITLITTTRLFRVSRAIAADLVSREFVEVARLRGEGFVWILTKEIWPNAAGPIMADACMRLTFAILFLSSLSFLGLGIQPPAADWGLMVRENAQALLYGSYAPVYPAAAIGMLTIGISFAVDAGARRSAASSVAQLFR